MRRLMERVSDEILVPHDFLVAELLESLLHPVEVPLKLVSSGLSAAFEQLLTLVRFHRSSHWEVAPSGRARD